MLNFRELFLLAFILESEEEILLIFTLMKRKRVPIYSREWYHSSLASYDDMQFRWAFRMQRSCMNFIIEKFFTTAGILDNRKNRATFHILVYYAAHNISYRALGEKFGLPASTVHRNTDDFLSIFLRKMSNIYIKKPVIEEMPVLSHDFRQIRDLSGTILAIDGNHIPIEAPKKFPEQYINRKGWYSIVFQLVVDSKYIIRDVFGGQPGSNHDAFIYASSSFKTYVDNCIPQPYFVIGDAAYPSGDHLLVPFRGALTRDQEIYNTRQSSQRMCVEGTIGRLKGRFRRFRSATKNGEQRKSVSLFYFSCIVHNIIELHKLNEAEDYYQEYLNENQISDE